MEMSEYQRALVEQNLCLVDWVIRHRITVSGRSLLTYEDFYQIGCEALCRAAMKYDPAIGPFNVFGCRYIYNAMIDHIRKENSIQSHAAELLMDDENDAFVFLSEGMQIDYEDLVISRQLQSEFHDCGGRMSGVAQRGIEAIELKILGYSSREIAEMFGTTVNNVNAWISRARQKLKADRNLISCCP